MSIHTLSTLTIAACVDGIIFNKLNVFLIQSATTKHENTDQQSRLCRDRFLRHRSKLNFATLWSENRIEFRNLSQSQPIIGMLDEGFDSEDCWTVADGERKTFDRLFLDISSLFYSEAKGSGMKFTQLNFNIDRRIFSAIMIMRNIFVSMRRIFLYLPKFPEDTKVQSIMQRWAAFCYLALSDNLRHLISL